MLSWELWLSYQFDYNEDFYISEKWSNSQHVAFAERPTTIPPPKHNYRKKWHFWRPRLPGDEEPKLQPLPILRSKQNCNFSAELELLRESENESFEAFIARYLLPPQPVETIRAVWEQQSGGGL